VGGERKSRKEDQEEADTKSVAIHETGESTGQK
jgi:hypothetical protein